MKDNIGYLLECLQCSAGINHSNAKDAKAPSLEYKHVVFRKP
jgi:hypothetical protein